MHQANAFIPPGAAALGVGLYTLFHPGLRKGNGGGGDGEAPEEHESEPVEARVPADVLQFP
jgi:hypothetical protein